MNEPSPSPADSDGAQSAALREFDDYAFGYVHAGSQLKDHIYERSRRWFAAGDAQRDALRTVAEVRNRQERIRRDLLASLGGLPASDTPLYPRIMGAVELRGFRVEKIIFESRPRHYVTANLYLPAERRGPTPAVLFLSGHHADAKVHPEYQAVCQTLARAGLVVLAIDPLGQGERLSYFDPETGRPLVPACTRDHDTAGAQCRFLGDSLARYFLHDAMRAIDYLHTRAEVDPNRIGVTGNSGGGVQVSLLMMADSRIAAAAPGTFIMARDSYQRTGQPQDAEQIWPGFTRAGYDHEDILLAFAPKPVCVLAVTGDFFPIEGTRRTVTRARRVWKLFPGAPPLELAEDQALHAYTPALARAAAGFFARHLRGHDADLAGFIPEPLPAAVLQCTATGQVRTEYPGAEFVHDVTVARAAEAETARRTAAPDPLWLSTAVFRDREPCDLNLRVIERRRRVGEFEAEVGFWWSQPHLANLGVLLRPAGGSGERPVTVAVWDDGVAAISRHAAWIGRECAAGRAVLVLNLSGTGPLRPDPVNGSPMHEFYGTFHKFFDDLEWIGDSLVALRTHEVLRALDALPAWSGLAEGGLRLHGHGRMGVHARLAAALDPRVTRCDWEQDFRFADFVRTRIYDSRDVKSFTLPGVLRHFDLNEL